VVPSNMHRIQGSVSQVLRTMDSRMMVMIGPRGGPLPRLVEAGCTFEVDPSDLVADPKPGVSPAEYAADLAWRKGRTAADTVCAVGDEILNKPIDRVDVERMIRLQEGHDTEVITGLCLHRGDRPEWLGAVEISIVRFRPLSDSERRAYLDSGRWEGKSGAYGVQDRDPFVAVASGSFSNVVGLPMERLAELLTNYAQQLKRAVADLNPARCRSSRRRAN
jgi:septum formation protein